MGKKAVKMVFMSALSVIFILSGLAYGAENLPAISASSSGAGHTPPRAFDGSTEADDFWEAETGGFPQWVLLSYAMRAKIVKYELQAGDFELDRMPKEWKFEGSNDGAAWLTLDERKDQSGWKSYETRAYKVAKPADYLHYRFYFIAGNAPLVRVYEIKVTESNGI
ncbi:MAG: discoidin domain-containing protein [Candidatus Omnitrophota bacterium]|nr:discoidin domain-containing protein [Candidatus Omnitrophota bacterium]